MIKKILFILLLIAIVLAVFFLQDNKKNTIKEKTATTIKQSTPKVKDKINIDYTKNPTIEKEIKLQLSNKTISNKNTDNDKYIKPQEITNIVEKKSNRGFSMDPDISFDKEKKEIDGINIKLEKRF